MLKDHQFYLVEIIKAVFKWITYSPQYEGKRPKKWNAIVADEIQYKSVQAFLFRSFCAKTFGSKRIETISRPVNYDYSTAHPTPEIVKKRLNLDRRRYWRTALPCTFIIAVSHFFRSSDHGPAIPFSVRPSVRLTAIHLPLTASIGVPCATSKNCIAAKSSFESSRHL